MTESKHVSEETLEDTAARVEAATDPETEADKPAADEAVDETDTAEDVEAATSGRHELPKPKRQTDWSRVVAFALLPALAFVLALGAGVPEIPGLGGPRQQHRPRAVGGGRQAKHHRVVVVQARHRRATAERRRGIGSPASFATSTRR